MATISTIIGFQEDSILKIENLRDSLRKLNTERRTYETVKKFYIEALQEWELVHNEHKKLQAFGTALPKEYISKLKVVETTMKYIQNFVKELHPDLVQNYDQNMDEEQRNFSDLRLDLSELQQKEKEKQLCYQDTPSTSNNNDYQQKPIIENEGRTSFKNNTDTNEQPKVPMQFDPDEMTKIVKMLIKNQSGGGNEKFQIRTPEIKLTEFSGILKDYRQFKNTFLSVMEKTDASFLEKFTILRGQLRGKALIAIDSLSVTDSNYNVAWSILDKRFNNKRWLIEENINSIINAKPIQGKNAESILNFIDITSAAIHNLEDLYVNIPGSSEFLVVIMMKKFDEYTKCRFEDCLGNTSDMPTLNELNMFLEKEHAVNVRKFETETMEKLKTNENYNRHYGLTNAFKENNFNHYNKSYNQNQYETNRNQNRNFSFENQNMYQTNRRNNSNEPRRYYDNKDEPRIENDNKNDQPKINNSRIQNPEETCLICNELHSTIVCPKFIASNDRAKLLMLHKVCIYCIKHKYDRNNKCQFRDILNCHQCGGHHVTQMHQATSRTNLIENQSDALCEIILPTALVNIVGYNNELTTVRCLIDQGSQSTYITEDIVQKLKLPKKKIDVNLIAVGGVVVEKSKWIVTISIKLDDNTIIKTKALVVKKITNKLPTYPNNITGLDPDKKLADPKYFKPSHIPILLGSNVLPQIIINGTETKNGILFQNTNLGWIISGGMNENINSVTSTHITVLEFENQLKNFWDMPNNEDCLDDEINYCEKLYLEKTKRTAEGRYQVPIPWKEEKLELGNSYQNAVRFYYGQETRWEKDLEHKTKSDAFMKEYLELEHMSPVQMNQQRDESGNVFYIPYISILRKDAITTKLRNVFNASSKSSNGVSVNETIHAGPKLQNHIFDVITKTRQYQYMYSSDVTKMYRQILILEEDRKFRIIWRANKNEPLMEYNLNTITYGLDCAPWQAIRTLHQVAEDNAPDEETKNIIKNSFYMDDLFHGNDTIEQCQIQINKIIETLEKGKLPLTKWISNNNEVLKNIKDENKISAYIDFDDQSNPTVKTLGLLYNPKTDSFSFKIKYNEKIKYTKRGLLAIAASLYDPIGWILPAIIKLRILIQSLWQKKYDWDDKIDESTQLNLEQCFISLNLLSEIEIPRWIQSTNTTKFQLIGFCDASFEAYAAVIYSRVLTINGYEVTIIASKGRVTPLKTKRIIEEKLCTIPKLELEAILLLSELYNQVNKCFVKVSNTISYTDSEVALAWVRSKKELLNSFVKRRVNKIHQIIKPNEIHYVKSEENPADPASRGLTSEQLLKNKLWFNGPQWIKNENLPVTPFLNKETTEDENIMKICTLFTATQIQDTNSKSTNFIERFSEYSVLIRTIARVLRWKNKNKGEITGEEITIAKIKILQYQQKKLFKNEINNLKYEKRIPVKHWMTCLSPFYDCSDNLIRVGGRLSNANLSEAKKHPILMTKCHLIDLIIRHVHLNHGHSGNQLTERLIREEFWIPSINQRIKKCIRSCVICIRWKARTIQPEMADLPAVRITPAGIFSQVGVDLCGPFNVKASRLKFDKIIKVWVAVFVCLVSKAVHLEIVSDISTDNFLAAFARFTSRRGCPTLVMSDNGTNFIGASNKIKSGWKKIVKDCQDKTAIQEITWKFIPTYSPTFGGLWEAAVKSMKYFVKRMANVDNLNYEEFNTLLCKIEGILNSRPLYPNSKDCEDEPALTPFHFLTQRNMKNSPSDAVTEKTPTTKKWLMIQQIQNQFWDRFNLEYLTYLQKRYKWKNPTRNLEVGDLVLLHDLNSPPAVWKMGKILKSFPDNKGVARQYTVKTNNKETVHRAAKRLIPLLPEDDNEEPALRTSRRTNTKQNVLLTRVLLCWLAFAQPVTSLVIQSLSPGIHIQRLNNASIKSFELQFAVTTSVNLTMDLNTINGQLKEFQQFCLQYNGSNYKKLYNHCNMWEKTIEKEANSAMEGIMALYKNSRQKRISPLVVHAIATGIVKYAPHIILAAGVTYQAYENHKMKKELLDIKSKIRTVSSLLLNLTDIEYTNIHQELSLLIDQQRQIILQEKINDYAAGIQTLILNLQAKHQNVINIRPWKELQQYLKEINDNVDTFALPSDDPEVVFSYKIAKRLIMDNLVTIQFNIVIVRAESYTVYVFISIPEENFKGIEFSNGKLVQQIALNKYNTTMFHIEGTNEIMTNVYENVLTTPINFCINELLKIANVQNIYQVCNIKNETLLHDEIIPIKKDTAIVIKSNINNKETQIKCDDETEHFWTGASIIFFPGCTLVSSKMIITPIKQSNVHGEQNVEETKNTDLQPIDIEVADEKIDPRIKQLQNELKTELSEDFSIIDQTSNIIITISLIAVLLIIALSFCYAKCKKPIIQPIIEPIELTERFNDNIIPSSWAEDWVLRSTIKPIIHDD